MNPHFLQLNNTLLLESGEQLVQPSITYHTYGTLNAAKDNVVWVTHALTANSDVFDWWKGLVGSHELINDQDYFIVCANVLGSHYGTTSPISINPSTGQPYYHDFPEFTIRDIVQLHIELADQLGIDKIQVLLGGSMGGHQALEWAIMQPTRIEHLIVLATSAVHSPWGVAFNESQRAAIENDATWQEQNNAAGIEGMKVARSIALLSYRNYTAYHNTQQPSSNDLLFPDRARTYQRYQGEKLGQRFNAFSYWFLSKAMDSQNVGRNRGGVEHALQQISARTLVLSLENDGLFPLSDQLRIVQGIPNATHVLIHSEYGHDGFLLETTQISTAIKAFFLDHDPTSQLTIKAYQA